MAFDFIPCPIAGLYEVRPKVFGDSRGYNLESYNQNDFHKAGLTMGFVQDNQSSSARGVLRGLHFQKRHPQGKLVQVVFGRVYDVAVDLRQGSPTFGQYHGIVLDSELHNEFYIPEGFAHGFTVLSERAIFDYKCTDFYHPEDEGGIIWNDPLLNIDWARFAPLQEPLLSAKDRLHPRFDAHNAYFDIHGTWIGR